MNGPGLIQYVEWAYPRKYWYDILMGFKSELLVAYAVTLVFLTIIICVRAEYAHKKIDDATNHEENMAEIANVRLKIEKSVTEAE